MSLLCLTCAKCKVVIFKIKINFYSEYYLIGKDSGDSLNFSKREMKYDIFRNYILFNF